MTRPSVPHPRARLAPLAQVAELAARGAPPEVVFARLVDAASALLGGRATALVRFDDDGSAVVLAATGSGAPAGARTPADADSLAARVRRTASAVRVDDFTRIDLAGVRAGWGVRAAVAVPVVLDGRPWGLLAATSGDEPLPAGTEHRLDELAEIAGAAVAGAQAWSRLRDLADEQAALRRVAELVARGGSQEELFAAVATEASALVGEDTTLVRLDGERTYTVVAVHGGPAPVGTRVEVPADDEGVVSEILRTGRAARLNDYGSRGPAYARDDYGVRAGVAVPVTVEGRTWGALAATTTGRPLPGDVERRLAQFTDLVAAAVAGAQTRTDLQQLADEQRALLTVAHLVAHGAAPHDLFAAVAAQASGLLEGVATTLTRFDGPGHLVVVASHGGPAQVGERIAIAPGTLPDRVRSRARVERVDDYRPEGDADLAVRYGIRATILAPILVAGEVWGSLAATSPAAPLPPGTEGRLEQFAELVGAALASVHARSQLLALAEEQAALRRVAELVARGTPPAQVFAAVTAEASSALGDIATALTRYDGEHAGVVVAGCRSPVPVGLRVPTDGDTGTGLVLRTGRPVRVDDFDGTTLAEVARELGVSASVNVPVVLEGRTWGTLSAISRSGPLPGGTEDQLAAFAELAAVAIAAAENKATLTASRARVIATADETRRRLQRDVHDSAQQRLVHTIVTLELARTAIADGRDPAELVEEALRYARRASQDLRDVVRGILPAVLTHRGLAAGLEALVDDVAVPVTLRLDVPRLPAGLETTAYFVVAEAIANVVKHAAARRVVVEGAVREGVLVLEVRDDGRGGADPGRGAGLVGMLDRAEAAEGVLTVSSPPGGGTTVRLELPVAPQAP